MSRLAKRFLSEEKGQGMTEYGLILGLIAIVVIGAITLLGTQIKAIFNKVVSGLGGTPAP